MPDHDLTSAELPELTNNEPSTPATNSFADSALEKIRVAGEKVFDKFSIPFKRGRGRPRKDGQPKANDVFEPSQNELLPVVAAAANPVHDGLFARATASAMRGVVDFARNLCRKKAGQAGIDLAFTEKALAECEVEPQVMADFSESLKIVLEKYNCRTDYAPEIALAVSAGRMVAPFALLLQTFNAEIKRKQAAEGGAK